MTTQTAELKQRSYPPASAVTGPRSTSWWGMVILILNEAIIFASLLASYFYLRFNSPFWPPSGIQLPELVLPSINTVILIGSSFVFYWAVSGIRKGNQMRLKSGLAGTFILGLVFLSIQIYEYTQLEFFPQDQAYGSLFGALPAFMQPMFSWVW